jgi:hypothetical protein
MAAKPWLRQYLRKLASTHYEYGVNSETELDHYVRFPSERWSRGKILLQALEYERCHVKMGTLIQQGSKPTRADYVIGSSDRWILDLKRPGEKLRWHAAQIQSHMHADGASLGVRFNGKSALAFVNPSHSVIRDVVSGLLQEEVATVPLLDLSASPVLSADIARRLEDDAYDCRELVKFFALLRQGTSGPRIDEIARQLAIAHIRQTKTDARQRELYDSLLSALKDALENPNEAVCAALIGSSECLVSISAKPRELLRVWQSVRFTVYSRIR